MERALNEKFVYMGQYSGIAYYAYTGTLSYLGTDPGSCILG